MTREEAIKVLNMVEAHGLAEEAKQMAISALEHICDDDCEHCTWTECPEDVLPTMIYPQVDGITPTVVAEPCDAISREAVLEQTYKWSKDEFLRVANPFDYLRKRINSLPPVTVRQTQEVEKSNFDVNQYKADIDTAYECGKASVRQTGEWKREQFPYYKDAWFCSECGRGQFHNNFNFCPNCGCRMVEPQESEDKE